MVRQSRVLVTGATGFIGGRLVEKLMLERNAIVRVMVRDFGRSARVARFPVEFTQGDLTKKLDVERATVGIDTVFHCAYDISSHQFNVDAIRAILSACIESQVRRLIHLSSISVYEPLPDGRLSEDSLARPTGEPYGDTKLQIEDEILRAVEQHGLDAVILQPSIVYGPYCSTWVTVPIEKMLKGKIVLPAGMAGLCNAVYVDDVVDACLLAAECESALGEKYLISGSSPPTWEEYFRLLEAALGLQSLAFEPENEILRRHRDIKEILRDIAREPNQIIRMLARLPTTRKALRFLYERLGSRLRNMASRAYRFERQGVDRFYLPSRNQLETYRKKTIVAIDKARRDLGYEPAFSFQQGMNLTSQYIRWAYPQADLRQFGF